jgi:hypothetical protein
MMKRSDEIVLDGLEPFALEMVSAEQWALAKQAVNDAGGILASDGVIRDLLEKASFASRSEAGRYAANMRWRGSVPQGGLATAQYRQAENAKAGRGAGNPARESDSDPANPDDEQSRKMATRARSIAEGDLSDIASIIRRDFREQGKKIPPAAQPYLDALSTLGTVDDQYGMDSGKSIVAYALSNLGSYKGETARLVKAELKARLKGKQADARSETNDSPEFTGRTTGRQGGPAEGPKYKKGMSLKEITANVRQDLKAVKLPAGVKLGVRMRGGMAVVVDIKGYTGDQNSPEAKALRDEVDAIRSAYNRSNSDPMVDYSDETYYGNTDFN